MTQSHEEKLAYQRGYSRANSRYWARLREVIRIAKAYRERSATPSDETRRCISCVRWERGGEHYLWGVCNAEFERGAEARMWTEALHCNGKYVSGKITTTEDFGCVNWIPRSNPRAVL